MKPKAVNNMDEIDKLLFESWEEAPDELYHMLNDIPDQVLPGETKSTRVITSILETILALWGLTTVYMFRGLWFPFCQSIYNTLNLPNMGWGTWFRDPFTAILMMLGFIFVTWWMLADLGETRLYPIIHKNKGPR